MDLMDQIYRQPSETKFNDRLCVSAYLIYSGSAQDDYRPKCLYLTGFAALLAYDDIKDWSKGQGDENHKRTANKLKDDFVPTWSEFTAPRLGAEGVEGNQNTIKQSRLTLAEEGRPGGGLRIDQKVVYRQLVDLGAGSRFSMAEQIYGDMFEF